jgi:hypothetical protein
MSFLAVALVSLAILLPFRGEFSANAKQLIETYVEAPEPVPIELLYHDLALHMNDSYVANLEGLNRLTTLFQIASGLLVTEAMLWAVSIVM